MANIKVISMLLFLAVLEARPSAGLQPKIRQKREWIVPPRKLTENIDYTNLEYIAKIRSDEETRTTIRYSLTGPGADQHPLGLFSVGHENGLVKISGVLDREKIPSYHLRGVAKFLNGSNAEKDIDLRIVVLDQNDCAPVFTTRTSGAVHEMSARDTFVMSITATDEDEKGTLNSKIAYSIVEQSPAKMFYIDRESGGIHVMHKTLDREIHDKYTLTVKGTDMNGASNGNSGMGEVVINILDENDNIPTLEKSVYECSVEENTKHVEVVRIQAIDADLIHTDNWLAVFSIMSGDEAGYFSISTLNHTNEGILILNKELDYEELKEVNLLVSISNKAAYHSSVVITQTKTYRIKVNVVNQSEGPRFKPAIKVITLSEDITHIDIRKIITNYVAIDSDTLLTATNVRYAKIYDIGNWLLIDEKTADIRLNKIPDYESKFLINGTYYAKIICITKDFPAKTATGTIAIQVEDFNDHCPILSRPSQTLCYGEHVVHVTAVDGDHYPNAEPFDFKVTSSESWSVQRFNDTTAIFRSHARLWPGVYRLPVVVRDQQGKFCGDQQVLQVNVCACDASKVCLPRRPDSRFGAPGVLLMLLGLLLLLLFPLLLLFCICGGAAAAANFPFDAKEHLIVYNTEGQGDDKVMALLEMSKTIDEHKSNTVEVVGGRQEKISDAVDAERLDWSSFHQYDRRGNVYHHHTHQFDAEQMYNRRRDEHMIASFKEHNIYEGLALSEAFLASYYSNRARCVAKEDDTGDQLLVYDYEDQESCMGSLEDICSFMNEDNLNFLDDLGLKFKTLAEICSGSTIETDINVSSPVTTKAVPSVPHRNVNTFEKVSGVHSQETENTSSASIILQASGVEQVSRASLTGAYIHEKVMVQNPPMFVQQPALYYTSTNPLYFVDPHPALLVTASPVQDVQENMVVVDKKNMDTTQHTTVKHDMQQYQGLVLLENQLKIGSLAAQSSLSGAEMKQSTAAHDVSQVLYSASRRMPAERTSVDSMDMRVCHSVSTNM
ncbi:desmoglein-2-like protein isoform X1 [Triplophysa dalaica]|uniref:desmoglein-2-like protein isoform X1 n=1 Tax=Triplophysa dalaica TaxID=1582913 RepID=UPI0024DF8BB5|nr:desmoglein-2-like protein isoform X1 [Triplophysa dalaica]